MTSKLLLHNIFRVHCNIWDFLFPGLVGGCVGVVKAEIMAVPGGKEVVAAHSTCDQASYHLHTCYSARKSYNIKNLIN